MSDDSAPLRFRYDSEFPKGKTYSVRGEGYVILVLGTKPSRWERLKKRLTKPRNGNGIAK